MSKLHNEVKETQSLVDDIEKLGYKALDEGDLELINKFIKALEPYLQMVDSTINALENKLSYNECKEAKKQLSFYNYKSIELHRLIPELKKHAVNTKACLVSQGGYHGDSEIVRSA
ncbi:TPA: hypothetical protein R1960_001818 [Staphylococcus delphini]|nr:hypothetical protein [Staphylococcus delphini]